MALAGMLAYVTPRLVVAACRPATQCRASLDNEKAALVVRTFEAHRKFGNPKLPEPQL